MSTVAENSPGRSLSGLDGRVVLVTGAGMSGPVWSIGRAIAVDLAGHGAVVGVVDRDQRAADATVAEIAAAGGSAVSCRGDVSDEADCRRSVVEIHDAFGRLDILVNNVGVAGSPATIDAVSVTDWDMLMAVNLKSVLLMSKHALPLMTSGGAVINISSTSAARPGMATAYGPAKAAVEALTRATAFQYGPSGIRANCVAPGAVWTELMARLVPADQHQQRREQRRMAAALQTEGTAWDIAHAVRFLASDQARWITGQVLTVDGGAGLLGPS